MTKIILVEDSLRVRKSLKAMLGEIDGVVISGEFEGTEEAIRGIDQACPDLVIIDIGLRSGNGLEVLDYVRNVHPHVETIVFSDRAAHEYRARAAQLGATHFFSKLNEIEQLYAAVTAVAGAAQAAT